MTEKLFQFIWQNSLYNIANLVTKQGEKVTVIHAGKLNRDAGPDFLEARVRIGNTMLVGNVELHINTGDYFKHNHQNDPAYTNLILHVVYKDDGNADIANVPLLELGSNISTDIIKQYTYLIDSPEVLPCAAHLNKISDLSKESWLSRMLAERWEQKLGDWKELLDESAGDWRNLLYWRMAANFGFKVNATPFLMLARSIPLNVLAKHKDLTQIEALLFGQAGMLEGEFEEDYPQKLQREYQYLQKKYKLEPILAHLWKFMRMRPANFPTIRIAQFAALVHKSLHLFSQIVEAATVKDIMPLLEVKASEYWETHVKFDEPQKQKSVKRLGKSSVLNIIINTVAPIRFLYARQHGESAEQEKALQLLEEVASEQNTIIRKWLTHGWEPKHAAHSQALIQLYNNYCSEKRCLECSIGHKIMRSAPVEG